jgi:hypothetical protein
MLSGGLSEGLQELLDILLTMKADALGRAIGVG